MHAQHTRFPAPTPGSPHPSYRIPDNARQRRTSPPPSTGHRMDRSTGNSAAAVPADSHRAAGVVVLVLGFRVALVRALATPLGVGLPAPLLPPRLGMLVTGRQIAPRAIWLASFARALWTCIHFSVLPGRIFPGRPAIVGATVISRSMQGGTCIRANVGCFYLKLSRAVIVAAIDCRTFV